MRLPTCEDGARPCGRHTADTPPFARRKYASRRQPGADDIIDAALTHTAPMSAQREELASRVY